MIGGFARFIGIDWSGAKSGYSRKIQVAVCAAGDEPPALVERPGGWRRAAVLDWLLTQVLPGPPALIGFDFSFAPPYVDCGAYLPGSATADDGPGFWAHVESICAATDLGAADFVTERYRRYFYLGAADGPKAPYMRLRACERRYNATGGRKPSSVFDAIGAAQVAKASFAGMRLLHRLHPHVAIWPFQPHIPGLSAVVEIYCQAFLRQAGLSGRKIRDVSHLDQALAALGSPSMVPASVLTDDMTDALVASAALRACASDRSYWTPSPLSAAIACTEGWTYGVC